jgi:hypothetical protein
MLINIGDTRRQKEKNGMPLKVTYRENNSIFKIKSYIFADPNIH